MSDDAKVQRYVPANRGGIVWRWSRLITGPFVRRSSAVRSGERSFREASDRAIELAIGEAPDPEQRRDLLMVLTNSAIIMGAMVGGLGVATGYIATVVLGDAVGRVIPRVFAVAFAAPLLGLSAVWAVRWFLNDRDMRRQQDGNLPGRGTQPSDLDFLYATPLAVLLGIFFALV